MGTLALILIPAALFIGAVILAFALSNGLRVEPARPWWSYPGTWIALSTVFVLVGITVFPRLLGFTFVFLPLVWMRGFGGRRDRGGRRGETHRGPDDEDHWPTEHDERPRPDGDEL
jgi:hypothetical protein